MSERAGVVQAKSKSTERYDVCPECKGSDLNGPIDTPLNDRWRRLVRSWWCRTCWWSTSTTLYDDSVGAVTR